MKTSGTEITKIKVVNVRVLIDDDGPPTWLVLEHPNGSRVQLSLEHFANCAGGDIRAKVRAWIDAQRASPSVSASRE